MTKPFYITTAIHYTNGPPHLGHAYENIAADVIARWHKKLGEEVFFLTGTDEHGQKVEKAALKAGLEPQEFVDKVVPAFHKMNELFGIENNAFIRTTDERHVALATNTFQQVLDKGDIYLGEYEGLYCDGCERFMLERDLVDGNCPNHDRPPQKLKEPSYFFKLSNYEEQLKKHFASHPDFVKPESRYNEVLNRLEEGLRDLSVTRTSIKWGVPTQDNPDHIIYVWFDALLNYISGLGDEEDKFWPADVHLVGKDVNWFHSVIWPCILLATGRPLPKTIFVHGFINLKSGDNEEAKKLSKSTGHIIDPVELAGRYGEFGPDAIRYFLMRDTAFGRDGEFSIKALIARINGELGNELGNLLSRIATMVHKFADGKVPDIGSGGRNIFDQLKSEYEKRELIFLNEMADFNLHKALGEAWEIVHAINRFIDEHKPWALAKDETLKGDLNTVLYSVLETLRGVSHYIEPFMPKTAMEIRKRIGAADDVGPLIEVSKWGRLSAGAPVEMGPPLFPRIEEE